MANAWRFPILDDGAEQGINDSGIATFKGSDLYNNLAREICQNSLDAKAPGQKFVIVEFNSLTLKKNDFAPLVELSQVFKDCRAYWKDKMEPKLKSFLEEAEAKLNADNIHFLVIRDFNTTGLGGAKAPMRQRSVWRALTHSNGVTDKPQGSGGSYGIGKTAPYACSSFRTVFYNSYAKEDGIKAFQGVARLITHLQNDEATQGTGFYQNTADKAPIFAEDDCAFRDVFHRDTYGTDVIVAGFKQTATWAEDIEKAVISNFFVAIANSKLVVRIDSLEISAKNLGDRIKYYADKEAASADKEKRITTILEFYQAITNPDHEISGSIIENDDAVLYIKKDDKYSKSIAQMRSIGMVVRTRHHNIYTRYAAVMMVRDGKLNDLLKRIEPPTHDKWDPGILEDDTAAQSEAEKYRRNLIRWMNDEIVKCCRSDTPDEIDLDVAKAYLPFDEDDKALGGDEPESDVSPDAASSFGSPTAKKTNVRKVSLTAKKVKGIKDDDSDPHNETGGGRGRGHGGTADPNGPDDVTAPVPGKKSVNAPKVMRQRIIQMPSPSLYRVALRLEEDCPKANIAIKAIGDDGRKENLTIVEYKMDKKKHTVNSNQMVLTNLKADTPYEIFLTLEYSEKMKLELLVY